LHALAGFCIEAGVVCGGGHELRQLFSEAFGLLARGGVDDGRAAIAVASGVSPARGLYTAIVGGFFVSLLGGSRFQVGGPAGAFIVLVAQTAQQYGVDGVILATLMAGAILIVAGLLRLGTTSSSSPIP